MDLKLVNLFASVLFVGALCVFGTTGANADGRIALTSAELDDVTALARYAPAEVGELREAAGDDVTFLDRLRRQIAREIDGLDPARPVSDRHTMPAMAPTAAPTAAPASPPVTSAPAPSARQASVSIRQLRSGAARMPHVLGNRGFSSGRRFSLHQ